MQTACITVLYKKCKDADCMHGCSDFTDTQLATLHGYAERYRQHGYVNAKMQTTYIYVLVRVYIVNAEMQTLRINS